MASNMDAQDNCLFFLFQNPRSTWNISDVFPPFGHIDSVCGWRLCPLPNSTVHLYCHSNSVWNYICTATEYTTILSATRPISSKTKFIASITSHTYLLDWMLLFPLRAESRELVKILHGLWGRRWTTRQEGVLQGISTLEGDYNGATNDRRTHHCGPL